MTVKNFRDLKVWKKSHQLVLQIYRASNQFPADERFGLTSQIRCASVSIPSNIAKSCGRDGDADFARFLQIALGSASEAEYQFLLARDLGFLTQDISCELIGKVVEVKRMLGSFIKTLRSKTQPPKSKS